METRAPGRIYVQVGGNDLLRIVLFDKNNKRTKVIEKDKRTKDWHVHHGYEHTEYGEGQHEKLTAEDEELLAVVVKTWNNRKRA